MIFGWERLVSLSCLSTESVLDMWISLKDRTSGLCLSGSEWLLLVATKVLKSLFDLSLQQHKRMIFFPASTSKPWSISWIVEDVLSCFSSVGYVILLVFRLFLGQTCWNFYLVSWFKILYECLKRVLVSSYLIAVNCELINQRMKWKFSIFFSLQRKTGVYVTTKCKITAGDLSKSSVTLQLKTNSTLALVSKPRGNLNIL